MSSSSSRLLIAWAADCTPQCQGYADLILLLPEVPFLIMFIPTKNNFWLYRFFFTVYLLFISLISVLFNFLLIFFWFICSLASWERRKGHSCDGNLDHGFQCSFPLNTFRAIHFPLSTVLVAFHWLHFMFLFSNSITSSLNSSLISKQFGILYSFCYWFLV